MKFMFSQLRYLQIVLTGTSPELYLGNDDLNIMGVLLTYTDSGRAIDLETY